MMNEAFLEFPTDWSQEMDYLSQLCFELYEAETSYSIRITISPGCHTLDPLDLSLDSRHLLGCAPRRSLTDHEDWSTVIQTLKSRFDEVKLPKSFLAVNVSAKHEEDAHGAGEMMIQEDDGQLQASSRNMKDGSQEDS
jgi:hypothetical protein